MPWKETTKMEEREEMIRLWESRLYGKSELARRFGVSRPTIDKWIDRFDEDEEHGLEDRPPIPGSYPHRTDPKIAKQLIEEKRKHLDWGPGILIPYLHEQHPKIAWPAPSTAGGILKSAGLVKSRRRKKIVSTWSLSQLEITEPEETMTVDHKGQFRLGNGEYCFPLPLANPSSRFIYGIDSLGSTSEEQARPGFERVFEEHGLPKWILSDNGNPFCYSRALCGLTQLSAWWIKLGIQPVRIRKGAPWQNGIHERMHKTLKESTTRPPEDNLGDQQKRFDEFRHEFNHLRPHSAHKKKPPITAYQEFSRRFTGTPKDPTYPGHFERRRVRSGGAIKWHGDEIFLTTALKGEMVGLEEIDDGLWALHYSTVEIGRFDEQTRKVY